MRDSMAGKVPDDRVGEVVFKVNGEEIRTPHRTLTAAEILDLAEKRYALPERYVMPTPQERHALKGANGTYKRDDAVDLRRESNLISIPLQVTTPV